VPLIMNCPGTLSPRQEDYLTQGIDAVPTALGILGVPPSPNFQGTNVLAEARIPNDRRMVFIHNSTLVRATADAIITGTGWKYVYDRATKVATLYDLLTDPEELKPEMKRPDVAQTLDHILQRWRAVQLAYYARPEYYGIYFPPPTPKMSDEDYAVLKR
jgi:arylsulfatase A-like enzyme